MSIESPNIGRREFLKYLGISALVGGVLSVPASKQIAKDLADSRAKEELKEYKQLSALKNSNKPLSSRQEKRYLELKSRYGDEAVGDKVADDKTAEPKVSLVPVIVGGAGAGLGIGYVYGKVYQYMWK